MKLGQTQLRDGLIIQIYSQVNKKIYHQIFNQVNKKIYDQVYDKLYEQERGRQIGFQTKINI
jgi:DNA-binding transcriptional regulator YhcF (GntR family)